VARWRAAWLASVSRDPGRPRPGRRGAGRLHQAPAGRHRGVARLQDHHDALQLLLADPAAARGGKRHRRGVRQRALPGHDRPVHRRPAGRRRRVVRGLAEHHAITPADLGRAGLRAVLPDGARSTGRGRPAARSACCSATLPSTGPRSPTAAGSAPSWPGAMRTRHRWWSSRCWPGPPGAAVLRRGPPDAPRPRPAGAAQPRLDHRAAVRRADVHDRRSRAVGGRPGGLAVQLSRYPRGAVIPAAGTWLGAVDARLLFHVIAFGPDRAPVNPFRGVPLGSLLDAGLYLGQPGDLTRSRPNPAIYLDPAYWEELQRRSALRGGRAVNLDSSRREQPAQYPLPQLPPSPQSGTASSPCPPPTPPLVSPSRFAPADKPLTWRGLHVWA
jgi:hypothetical protein